MTTSEDQLADFLKQASDFERAVPDGADLFKAMGVTGDDAFELMDSVSTQRILLSLDR